MMNLSINYKKRLLVYCFVLSTILFSHSICAENAIEMKQNIDSYIRIYSNKYKVDPFLIHEIVRAESNYNKYAVSPKGAKGLMQLMDKTGKLYGVTNPYNAKQNIKAGIKHFKYLLDYFNDERLALAAYNAGEAAVIKYKGIPNYKETQNYVNKIMSRWAFKVKPAFSVSKKNKVDKKLGDGKKKTTGFSNVVGFQLLSDLQK